MNSARSGEELMRHSLGRRSALLLGISPIPRASWVLFLHFYEWCPGWKAWRRDITTPTVTPSIGLVVMLFDKVPAAETNSNCNKTVGPYRILWSLNLLITYWLIWIVSASELESQSDFSYMFEYNSLLFLSFFPLMRSKIDAFRISQPKKSVIFCFYDTVIKMISVVYLLHPGLGLAVPGCEQWRISLFLGAYNFRVTDESPPGQKHPRTKAPPN